MKYESGEEEEISEDCCRVCRSGKEDGQLFTPCKCSGSIRFVHESCLTEWLARSKKNKCELCKSEIVYTKVFLKTMPDQIPFYLLVKRLLKSILSIVVLILRAILVASCWLLVLPYITILMMRAFLFTDAGLAGFGSSKKVLVYGEEFIKIFSDHSNSSTFPVELKNHILKKIINLPSNFTMEKRKEVLIKLLDVLKNGTSIQLNQTSLGEAVLNSTNSTSISNSNSIVGNLAEMVNTQTAAIFRSGEVEPWRRIFK